MSDPPAPRPLAGALDALLRPLGLASGAARLSVEEAAAAYLTERAIDATVVSLRWGVLTIEAPPPAALLLRYESDALLAHLNEADPGVVEGISLQVRG